MFWQVNPPRLHFLGLLIVRRSSSETANVDFLVRGIRNFDRPALAHAITLIESSLAAHRQAAQLLLAKLSATGPSRKHSETIRVGLSGSSGVGKSTFIEALGLHILKTLGLAMLPSKTPPTPGLAVLAVDPSSLVTGGSILGDKTRMPLLATHPSAFIRPSPSSGFLGGITRATHDTLTLLHHAAFPYVLVETVGVGQSEIAVSEITDMMVLLVAPGAGDELQGLKRGIVEMADAVVVNKADAANLSAANETATQYASALMCSPRMVDAGRQRKVLLASSKEGSGIAEVWEHIIEFIALQKRTGHFEMRRQKQTQRLIFETAKYSLLDRFEQDRVLKEYLVKTNKLGAKSIHEAAQDMLDIFIANQNNK